MEYYEVLGLKAGKFRRKRLREAFFSGKTVFHLRRIREIPGDPRGI